MRKLLWISAIVAGTAMVAVGVYLAVTDLDRADKVASVTGAIISLVGLGASGYGLVLARRAESAPATDGDQTVERVDARSGIDVVDDVAGSVRLGAAPPPRPSGAAPRPPERAARGEQVVRDVRTGGHVRLIRGVGGDVDSGS